MRYIVYALLLLLVGIQYPLWISKGGWLYVYQLDKEVKSLQESNKELEIRNAKIAGDVDDLKQGTRGVEERARLEQGMVKDNEILVKILNPEDPLPKPVKPTKENDQANGKDLENEKSKGKKESGQKKSSANVEKNIQ